jgi:TonB family protein
VDGHEVWVAADTGPAVVGFVNSRIVLPEWVLERSAHDRRMVIAHEAEHLGAGDPRLLFGGLLLAAALPWNPALWWQWRRLRHAVEVDCDLRVLARGLDARAYGRLLVEVTERGTARRLAVAALSESRSSLERRIKLMFSPKPRGWWIRATVAAALAVVCVAVACTADIPSGPGSAPAVNATSAPRSDSPDFAYEVAVLSRAPELSNKGEIGSIMERLYPRLLQDAGIGGTSVVQFVIQPDGTPDQGSIKVVESDREELGAASVAAVRAFKFRPGQYKGENVRVLLQMPITWQPASVAARTTDPNRVEVRRSESQSITQGVDLAAPSRSVASTPGSPDFAYEVAVLSRVPELQNKGEIGTIRERLYPRLLQDAGIGGTVVAQFVIEPNGTVDMGSFKILESSNAELSAATRHAIERFRFIPGQYRGENVRVIIQMPVTWQPAG